MSRAFNFSPGPSMLPASVIEKMQNELLDFRGSGMSVMEISHRSKDFLDIIEQCKQLLRKLLKIPDNYSILFQHGGASMQFAAVALNLSSPQQNADYIITGQWGLKAYREAQKFSQVRTLVNTMESMSIPEQSQLQCNDDAAYVHYTPNETILGLEFPYTPDVGEVPLIGDFSSTILSREIEVEKHGVIYACCQKNMGISGLAVTIVREDLLNQHQPHTPSLLEWKSVHDNNSLGNTAPTFALYALLLCVQWLDDQGGVSAQQRVNKEKARLLYEYIDQSPFYSNRIAAQYRSTMNVPFILNDSQLDTDFLQQGVETGLTYLKGHASVGGMRASLYNAMPKEGVLKLIDFMQHFADQNGY